MIHKIFTVFDQKAKAYLPPFFMHQEGMSVRTFKDCVQSSDHQFGKNPEDYQLFSLGTFDDENGKIEQKSPDLVVSAVQLVEDIVLPHPYAEPENAPEVGNEAPVQRDSQSGNSA